MTTSDVINAIGKKSTGSRAVYEDQTTGEVKITAEYTMPVLKIVMAGITKERPYMRLITIWGGKSNDKSTTQRD